VYNRPNSVDTARQKITQNARIAHLDVMTIIDITMFIGYTNLNGM
jgi:hypothetical protein